VMATEVQNPVATAVGVSPDGKTPPYSNFESDTVAVKSPPQKSRIPCVALAVALCAAVVANVALGFGIVAYVRVSDNSTSAAPAAAPAAARKCEGSDLTIVRDVKTLTPEEKYKLVAGMKKMKKEPSKYDSKLSAWDYFVSIHKAATVPQEQVHAGWYFYPWHRVMLARFVSELRRVTGDSTIHFPYWNWADIESSASMFEIDYLGPRAGSPAAGYVLVDGNFGRGNWTIDKSLASLGVEKTTLSLARSPGNGLQMCEDTAGNSWMLDTIYNPRNVDNTYLVGPFRKLSPVAPPTDTLKYLHPKPGNVEVDWESLTGQRQYVDDLSNPTMTLTCNHFATTLPTEKDYTRCSKLPYTEKDASKLGLIDTNNIWATTKDYSVSYSEFFRACFEGIDPADRIAKGLERLGASLHPPHGATHTYMGGSLATPTSPNDPIFTHLHFNVDRKFAEWQKANGNDWFLNGPMKDKLDKPLPLFDDGKDPITLRQSLDYKSMGFDYDTTC